MAGPAATVHARCLCGQLAISCVLPTKWVAHCHCTMCQRAHGAGFVTWAGFDAGQIRFESSSTLTWYASSPGAERGFCGTCGSPMLFRSARWPGELHVARALFTGPLDREPQAHVFFDTRVPWMPVDDHLPRKS